MVLPTWVKAVIWFCWTGWGFCTLARDGGLVWGAVDQWSQENMVHLLSSKLRNRQYFPFFYLLWYISEALIIWRLHCKVKQKEHHLLDNGIGLVSWKTTWKFKFCHFQPYLGWWCPMTLKKKSEGLKLQPASIVLCYVQVETATSNHSALLSKSAVQEPWVFFAIFPRNSWPT